MSRFEEVVNEAIDDVVLGEAPARRGARRPHRRAGPRAPGRPARRGHDRRPLPGDRPDPGIGPRTQEIYTLFGTAVASERGTRTLTGVQAQGMTACPCAQGLVADRARERLAEPTASTTTRSSASSSAVPVATHNQRGIGTLHIGRPEGSDLEHRRPRPAAHRRAVDELGDLRADEALRRGRGRREGAPPTPASSRTASARWSAASPRPTPSLADGGFLLARQENLETIHRHNVVAERSGLLAEILAELETGEHSRHHVTHARVARSAA